jgi:hypothetical protein
LGIMTRSSGRPRWSDVRKTSRIRRFARFLVTAPPSLRDATIPRRVVAAGDGAATAVNRRPWVRLPSSKTRWNSLRRRNLRSGGSPCARIGRLPNGRP